MAPTVENRFWRDPALPGLEIRHTRAEGFAFQRHTHETYSVGVVEQGGSYVFDHGAGPRVMAGQTMLLEPGRVHSGTPVDQVGITYKLIYVEPEWLRSLATELDERTLALPGFPKVVVDDPHLLGAVDCLSQLVASGGGVPGSGVGLDSNLIKESAATVAFSWLLSRHADPGARLVANHNEPRAVRLAQEYLADRLGEKVSLEDLARVAGLSRYHLLRVFKRATGLPPHAWQTQLRLDRARRLLTLGREIADVALETGFTDQSHFSNTFKKYMGMTPSQYRLA